MATAWIAVSCACAPMTAQQPAMPKTPSPETTLTLRDAGVKADRLVGAALSAYKLRTDAAYAAIAAEQFNYVTAENEMKPNALEPEQGKFIWQIHPEGNPADQIMDFAAAHGMKVKGHNLLWHQQYPQWMLALNAAQIHDAFVNHAHQVVKHFKGRVIAWDVVNEVIDDGNQNQLRAGDPKDNPLYYRLGNSDAERRANLYQLIRDLFAAAHQEDPAALLFYNDYGIEGAGPKADAAYALALRLQADGAPISGVGFQTHISWNSPPASELAANMHRLTEHGLIVNISEMDIEECGAAAGQGDAAQAKQWRAMVAACVAERGCQAVSTWGIDDKDSWIKTCKKAPNESPRPLMFDDHFQPKPSYAAMRSALLKRE